MRTNSLALTMIIKSLFSLFCPSLRFKACMAASYVLQQRKFAAAKHTLCLFCYWRAPIRKKNFATTPYGVDKIPPIRTAYAKFFWGSAPNPAKGLKPLGTRHRFDVFVSEPGTDNTRCLEKWGLAPPFFVPATYHFVNDL